MERRHRVLLQILAGVLQAEAHVGVCGEVKYELAPRHRGGQRGQVEIIPAHEPETGSRVRAVEKRELARGKIIPADDLVAFTQKPVRQTAADKPGRAGNEIFHAIVAGAHAMGRAC